jgi:dihydroorotase-like cyclic amidohydrolase
VTIATTFHDLLDPLSGERCSLTLADGQILDRAESLSGGAGRDLDASGLWLLPALYDADAHFPLLNLGLRQSDVLAMFEGGVATVNVAIQWHEIVALGLETVVADLTSTALPKIVPILSVHSDMDSTGFPEWLAANVATMKELMPPVCKLYSYGHGFWENLEAVVAAGLRPVVYCKDFEDVEAVVARAGTPVHFRHAISEELITTMSSLEGATLQTSPHFLLPVLPEHRGELFVLPPVADDDVRESLASLVPDKIDLIVSDHNAPPFAAPTGPGLQVEQDFMASVLSAADLYGWPLAEVWAKVTTNPAALYQVDLGDGVVVVDPEFRREVGLYPPRQTPDRAPYLGLTLRGRALAIGSGIAATLV